MTLQEVPTSIGVSKSGAEVLCVGHLATASLVQPEAEGRRWAEAQRKRLTWLREDEPVVVLGVGSGFHLRALVELLTNLKAETSRALPKIYAVDTCLPSIDFCKARCPGVIFQQVIDADSFLTTGEIQSWILQSYTLLSHRPTLARTGAQLLKIEEILLGRTPESFSQQLRLRPQVASAINPGRAKDLALSRRISIRDLAKTWDISSETKIDRRIFRVLEELVR